MRVVADTNVIVSILLWGGALERFFVLVNKRKVILCFSPDTIDELFRVLHYPKIAKQAKKMNVPIQALLDRLISSSVICYPTNRLSEVKNDDSDNRILEAALAAGAGWIISGDKHLLALKNFKGILIISANEFIRSYEE